MSPAQTTTYTVTCTGSGSITRSVTVTVTAASPDPSTTFSVSLGGGAVDAVEDVYVDQNGYVYVTGGTSSTNFPTTTGAPFHPDPAGQHSHDAFVAKFSPGGQLVCATLLGGQQYDHAYAIEVNEADPQKPIYVAGRAGAGYPTTAGALQPTFGGDISPDPQYGAQDGFVTKLSNDCTNTLWSTYVGEDGKGVVHDVAVDAVGSVYLASQADRPSPFVTPSAWQATLKGVSDGLLVKLNASGQLVRATYVGGSGEDGGAAAIRVDGAGTSVFYLAETRSNDAPVTSGVLQPTLRGTTDLFLAKFSSALSQELYGTYLGGSAQEMVSGHSLAVDASGNAVVGATTTSSDFPVTQALAQGVQRAYGGSGGAGTGLNTDAPGDGVIATLSGDGSRLLAATYLGGLLGDGLQGLSVAASGEVWAAGTTFSANFPTTADALQRNASGSSDGWLAKLPADLSQLDFSTYVGSSLTDQVHALAMDRSGLPHVVGQSGNDAFVVKTEAPSAPDPDPIPEEENQAPVITSLTVPQTVPRTSSASLNVFATDDGLPGGPLTYAWSKVSGMGVVTFSSPNTPSTSATFSIAGSYTIRITVSDGALSAISDSLLTVTDPGTVNQAPTVDAGPDQDDVPITDGVFLNADVRDLDGLPSPPGQVTVSWTQVSGPPGGAQFTEPVSIDTDVQFTAPGNYVLRLTASDGALSASDTVNVSVIDNTGGATTPPTITFSTPTGNTARISAGQSVALSWSSQNADVCEGFGGQSEWAGMKALSGSQSVAPRETTTYELTCSNTIGDATKTVQIIVGGASGTYTISAAPNPVSTIGQITATWTAEHPLPTDALGLYTASPEALIDIQQNAQGAATGAAVFIPQDERGWAVGTYTVKYLADIGGGLFETRATASLTVRPDVYSMTARPSQVIIGSPIMVDWTADPGRVNDTIGCYFTSNVDNQTVDCGVAIGFIGQAREGASGTENFTASMIPGKYEFRYLSMGQFVASTESNTVDVIAVPPEITFSAAPPTIDQGGQSTLSWTTKYAASCDGTGGTGSDGWVGPKVFPDGTFGPVSPLMTTPYTLSCTNVAGTTTKTVMLTVIPPVKTPTLYIAKKSADGTMSPWILSPNNEQKFPRGIGEQIFLKATGTDPNKQVRIKWTNGGATQPGEPWSAIFTDPNTGLPYTTNAAGEVVMGPFPSSGGVPDTTNLNCADTNVTCWPVRPGYEGWAQGVDPGTGKTSDWSNRVTYEVIDPPPSCTTDLTVTGPSTVSVGQPFNVSWTNRTGITPLSLGWSGPLAFRPPTAPMASCQSPSPTCQWSGLQFSSAGTASVNIRLTKGLQTTTCPYSVSSTGTAPSGLSLSISKFSTSGFTTSALNVTRASTPGGTGERIYLKIVGAAPNSDVLFRWSSWSPTNNAWVWFGPTTLPNPPPSGPPHRTDSLGSPLITAAFPSTNGVPNDWPVKNGYLVEVTVNGVTSNQVAYNVIGGTDPGPLPTCSISGPAYASVGAPFNVSWSNSSGLIEIRSLGWTGAINPRPGAALLPACPPESGTCTWSGLAFTSASTAAVTIRVTSNFSPLRQSTCSYSVKSPNLTFGKTASGSPAQPTVWSTSGTFSRTTHDNIWLQVANAPPNSTVELRWTDKTGNMSPWQVNWTPFGSTNSIGIATLGPFPNADRSGVPSTWPIGTQYKVQARINGVMTDIRTYSIQ